MTESPRAGVVATKAVNQYRKRDAFAYLGLRQLLKGTVSRSDEWATKIAVDQVTRRSAHSYFISEHFKERDASGENKFRKIVVPGPIEILAESALLTACAGRREFVPHEAVFTYHLAAPLDRSGIYRNYMDGLRARHQAIELACNNAPGSTVRFLDIKRFYPSIKTDDVKRAWREYSTVLSRDYQVLGEKLIDDHHSLSVDGSRGLLTGPMFSHFAANLVMREIDEWASSQLGVKYLRYVDDITLVGERSLVASATMALTERLRLLELELHDENSSKTIEVKASEWMVGRSDFEHDLGDLTWGRLVGHIKTYLTLHPDKSQDLASALAANGSRLPVLDYAAATREARHAESFASRARRAFFRTISSSLTVSAIVEETHLLKIKMEDELRPLLDQLPNSTGFFRKRLIPKLRFRIGRLAYLSESRVLKSFAEASAGVDELVLQREVIEATVTGSLKSLIAMGANAVQAASQPLVAGNAKVSLVVEGMTPVELQGVAVAVLNGVRLANDVTASDQGILDLSRGVGVGALKRSDSRFISEVALLAGKEGGHHDLLSAAFDEDEQLVLDAVERFEESAPRLA